MTSTDGHSFGQEHFGRARLGDQRRTRSLVDLADRCARHPGGTLPQKFKDPNALRRCYDLMNCRAVTHARVLEPHARHTLEAALRHDGVVLSIHDGSELDFSTLTSLREQLGQIGSGAGRGYQCMNSLMVLPAHKQVLGLANQILYARPEVPKDETRAQKRQREDRESLLWLRAVEQIDAATADCLRQSGQSPPAGLRLVDVVDRGGDTFEFLDREAVLCRLYVVRSQHNRAIRVGHDGNGLEARLHDHLRTLAAQGCRDIELSDRPERPARQACLAVAWAAVQVQAPENPRGQHRNGPLDLWAVRVWEPKPPAGAEAVEWFLLTPVAVAALAAAWEVVDWYCLRWVVEEFHKAQKTGCAIETPQFTTAERLQPMIALLSAVATTLLQLRSDSRDSACQGEPATGRVAPEYVEVLSGWRYQERRELTVREFFQALARLGGHQNRRGDGAPGWLVLWRGWTTLQTMVAGARAVRCLEDTPAVPERRPPPSRPPPYG
jgi:hypothetical protein